MDSTYLEETKKIPIDAGTPLATGIFLPLVSKLL
jgi:hypothetical protein